ncbi:hypothetical protein RISK_003133 [Rhodopirellula islandica]|uniref:Uncharacterized protein n=1 Tax=Rhodopirellula islandica TaxID=595434 RepID=A0A0J1BE84_RHOIS|nr:hypothetical protein RISK_003133 [Rhodopirellula islandica]
MLSDNRRTFGVAARLQSSAFVVGKIFPPPLNELLECFLTSDSPVPVSLPICPVGWSQR